MKSVLKMASAPQFSLRWNNYVSHVTDAFNLLRLENDMVDVTLCCEGGKIKAHKMLLSVCSDYFKQIFKENPCQHPVIIFKNVKFDDLNAIVNFMYHGEVNIFQEQLESFLITAEMLEVKGLTDNNEEEIAASRIPKNDSSSLDLSSKSKIVDDTTVTRSEEPINLATMQLARPEYIPQFIQPKPMPEEEIEIVDNVSSESSKTISTNINFAKPFVNNEEMQVDNLANVAEDLSEKSTSEGDMMFRCHICPKGFKHPTSLTLHKDSHAGKTQCPVCHRSFSRSYDMRSHLQRIHQGKQLTIKEIRYKSNSDAVSSKQYTQNI